VFFHPGKFFVGMQARIAEDRLRALHHVVCESKKPGHDPVYQCAVRWHCTLGARRFDAEMLEPESLLARFY